MHGAGCDFLIRVDAHGDFPAHYCRSLLETQAKTCADSVVVSMVAAGEGCFQRAAAAAQNSRLGNGGSSHRLATEGRWVDHGHHALMRLAAFQQAGGYDESFSHNEDAELDVRLRAAGFRIWLSGDTGLTYFPRATAAALFCQYLNYGRGRARNLLKHRQRPKLRQSLPLGVAPAVGLALLAPLAPILALPALTWAALCLVYGGVLGLRAKDNCVAAAGVAAMVMHFAWSLGFWDAAARYALRKVSGREPAALAPSERMGVHHDN
jgi:succinoglycan biosynthesis protein ExoA